MEFGTNWNGAAGFGWFIINYTMRQKRLEILLNRTREEIRETHSKEDLHKDMETSDGLIREYQWKNRRFSTFKSK